MNKSCLFQILTLWAVALNHNIGAASAELSPKSSPKIDGRTAKAQNAISTGLHDQWKFCFGTNHPNPGSISAAPETLYNNETGFGFESAVHLVAQSEFITSDQPFFFSVKLPEGNYSVKMTLGDKSDQSGTTVKAEARRLMLENVHTVKGEITSREITLNIRTPRIGTQSEVRLKQREKDTEIATWDDKLTLEFNGPRPCLRTLEITPVPSAPTIFIAGDSTVCDQPVEPWNSWGQMLPRFLQPGVAVANYAQSGESIKSSLSARRFQKIFNQMKSGDWLLIQFGHNDMKDRDPNALNQYTKNLKNLVAQTRAKGGTPILITSMERKAGVKAPTLAGYPEAVRKVAAEDNIAFVDLNRMSVELYQALGSNLDRAFQDGTHHNNYGSYELAKCVAVGILKAKLELAKFLVKEITEFDPKHPDPVDKFDLPPSPARSAAKPDGN
jgi:lysophospholipase L1-like esterase